MLYKQGDHDNPSWTVRGSTIPEPLDPSLWPNSSFRINGLQWVKILGNRCSVRLSYGTITDRLISAILMAYLLRRPGAPKMADPAERQRPATSPPADR